MFLTACNLADELPWLERFGVTPSVPEESVEIDRLKIMIVGNGEFPAPHGLEIDSFPTVVRFNAFKTKGFEESVGTRTTIHVLNSQNLSLIRENCSEHIQLLVDTGTPAKMFEFYFANRAKVQGLRIIRPSLYEHLGRLLKGRYKTQGFFFIELARLYFDTVTIAGFSGRTHYFNPRWMMYAAHPLDAEHEKYADWESPTFRQLP